MVWGDSLRECDQMGATVLEVEHVLFEILDERDDLWQYWDRLLCGENDPDYRGGDDAESPGAV